VGQPQTTFRWVTSDQIEVTWLETNATYEWWVTARSDYAHGIDSEIWQFTTPAGSSSALGNNPDRAVLIEQEDDMYLVSEVCNSK